MCMHEACSALDGVKLQLTPAAPLNATTADHGVPEHVFKQQSVHQHRPVPQEKISKVGGILYQLWWRCNCSACCFRG